MHDSSCLIFHEALLLEALLLSLIRFSIDSPFSVLNEQPVGSLRFHVGIHRDWRERLSYSLAKISIVLEVTKHRLTMIPRKVR
ncbi:hypothetical protein X777_11721 [Ooceraea biroi]|uniref:Secreted protein n=1 Tax=Ooceraea biroi TaxID=2015173 RepID=A0A026W395_OOCBI|nr:hypothetical protein X777_11721 [Ooceraea biroi]